MTVEIISWSISTKVCYRTGIELATPGSAVRHASVARHVLSILAALWSSAGKSADLLVLLCVMFSGVLSLSHMVSRIRCGTWLYRFLIFAFFFTALIDPMKNNYVYALLPFFRYLNAETPSTALTICHYQASFLSLKGIMKAEVSIPTVYQYLKHKVTCL